MFFSDTNELWLYGASQRPPNTTLLSHANLKEMSKVHLSIRGHGEPQDQNT